MGCEGFPLELMNREQGRVSSEKRSYENEPKRCLVRDCFVSLGNEAKSCFMCNVMPDKGSSKYLVMNS